MAFPGHVGLSFARSERARWVTALMHRERERPDSTPRGGRGCGATGRCVWAPTQPGMHQSHVLIWFCPPPPVDLSQVEITRAYMAKQADEISLQQADVVLLLGEEDGEWGLHLWAWPRWGTAWVALPQHHRE